MNYFGLLCVGLGILTLVAGMICTLLAIVSQEKIIKIKAKRLASILLPLAILALITGLKLTSFILSSS